MNAFVDLTRGDIVIYWGRCIQFPQWIHAFKFVHTEYAALPTDVEKWWRYVSHTLRRVCVRYSQSGRVISTETDEGSQTNAERLSHSRKLTNANGDV